MLSRRYPSSGQEEVGTDYRQWFRVREMDAVTIIQRSRWGVEIVAKGPTWGPTWGTVGGSINDVMAIARQGVL